MILFFLLGQFALADTFFREGWYDLAVIEYQRAFFFHPESLVQVPRRLNLAQAMLWVHPDKGIADLTRLAEDEPAVKSRVHAIMGDYFLSREDYPAAAVWLAAAEKPKSLGYALLHLRRLDQVRAVFSSADDQILTAEIDQVQKQPRLSPGTAMVLSLICPGAGEIYAGRIGLGLTDFLANAGTGYLLYNALKKKKYVDAGLIMTFLFNRFYFGSLRNARLAAEQANEKKYNRWLNAVKQKYFKDLPAGKGEIN